MTRSERDELRRAIQRFQELASPRALLALLERVEELEAENCSLVEERVLANGGKVETVVKEHAIQ